MKLDLDLARRQAREEKERATSLLEIEQRNARTSAAKASSSSDEAERIAQQLRDESHAHREALDLARRLTREEKERAIDLTTDYRREERELRTELDEQRMALKAARDEHERSLALVRDEHERSLAQVHDESISSEGRCEELMQEMSSIREDQSLERSSLLECNHVILESLQKVTERMDDIVETASRTASPDPDRSFAQTEEYFSRLSVEVRELRDAQSAAVTNIANGHETSHREIIALSTQFNVTIKTLLDEFHSQSGAVQSKHDDNAALVPLDRLETALIAQQESRAELSKCKEELEQMKEEVNASVASATAASQQAEATQARNEALQIQLVEATHANLSVQDEKSGTVPPSNDENVGGDAAVTSVVQNETQTPSDSQMEQAESEVQHQLDRLQAELWQAEERARAAEQQAKETSLALNSSSSVAVEQGMLQISLLQKELAEKEERCRVLAEEVATLRAQHAAASSELALAGAKESHTQSELQQLRELGDEQLRDAKRDYTRRLNEASATHEDALAAQVAVATKRLEGASQEVATMKLDLDLARRQAREEKERAMDLTTDYRREERELRTELGEQRMALKAARDEHERSLAQAHDESISSEGRCEELMREVSRAGERAREQDERCRGLAEEVTVLRAKHAATFAELTLAGTRAQRPPPQPPPQLQLQRHTAPNMSSIESRPAALYPVVANLLAQASHHAAADGYGQ
eukprot:COSAG06_NODE_490_length_15092_cov_5.474888_1_plen_707_part_00